MTNLNESIVEDAALSWFEELGYTIGHRPHMALGKPAAERNLFGVAMLPCKLRMFDKENETLEKTHE